MDISRRGLLSGAGVLGGAAVLGGVGAADAAASRPDATARPDTPPPGLVSISSAPQPGVSYRFASWPDVSALNDILSGRRFSAAGVSATEFNDVLGATFDLAPGAIVHDLEVYCSASVSASAGLAVWSSGNAGLANAIVGPAPVGPFANSALHAVKFTVPSAKNGPFPHGTKLSAYLSTPAAGTVGLSGFRVGFKNAPLAPVLITPVRIYDSRTHHAPLKAGKTRTLSLASHLPVGANGALYTLSVLDTHGHGSLHVGAGGSSLSAVGLQWSRSGDRVSAPVTSAVSATRTIGIHSAAGSGATDFIVDLTGYLV